MKTYEVMIKCVVIKSVMCECRDEDQARDDPWDHAFSEVESDQIDWEVQSVREVPA